MLSVCVRSRRDQLSAPLVSRRKLSAASAGKLERGADELGEDDESGLSAATARTDAGVATDVAFAVGSGRCGDGGALFAEAAGDFFVDGFADGLGRARFLGIARLSQASKIERQNSMLLRIRPRA